MSLPEFSVNRPVTTLMACLILILLGGIAFVRLPVDLMPELVYPTISVRAEYPGVAPEEMETLVARPLEEAFASAPGVEEITSNSSEGITQVRVGFEYGVDIDEAANELRIRLDRRRGTLPQDMEPPVMFKFDVSQRPIMFLTVAAKDMNPKTLRYFVEKQIQYRLERVPGVAQFTVRGGLRREIHVDLDLTKLRALDLSVNQIVDLVRRENLNRPVGPVEEGRFEVLLRTKGEFDNLDEIRNLVLTTRAGVPVYLRDVANVEDSHEEIRQLVSVDGAAAVRLFVYKQSGANTVTVADAVWDEVGRIHRDYPSVRISATGDTSEFIKASIGNLKSSAIMGSILAVVILLLFLRSFSSVLIIAIAIPVSVIATFALMFFAGFTLNTVSFGGLALGVGMLVDNAIVVLENIFRHRQKGTGTKEAAVRGSGQVGLAIAASTFTTIAVFVPVFFLSGMSVVTFQQLAYVVSFSLLCSLFVALTIVPMLCSKYLRVNEAAARRPGVFGAIYRWMGDVQDRLAERYGNSIQWALDHPRSVLATAVLLLVGSLVIAPLIGVELVPEADEGEVRVDVELEPGTRVEVTDALMRRLQRVVRENVPELKTLMVESGSGGGWSGGGTHIGELRIRLVDMDQRERSAKEIANSLRPKLLIQPGVIVRTRVSSGSFMMGSRSGGGDRLSVEIRGHDMAMLQDLSYKVRDAMLSVPGVPEVQISRRPGMPEMLLSIDRLKASTMGLNVSDIADAMETAVGGRRTSMYRQEGDEFNILVRLQERDRLALAQVGKIPLATPVGPTIPAESVVQMRRQEGPVTIERKDQERIVTVSGTLGDRDLGSVVRDLSAKLREIPKPMGYDFTFGGEYEEQQETFKELTFAAILALILVYMVMASQFESLRDPFIILFSIPLAAVGVIAILVITNTTFNMQGFLGVIILVGIVVNNAIILIDYMNQLRRQSGYSVRDAIVTGGTRRLRPILMTTTTTVLGLVPMALGIGEGSELQAPLARVVIGGLTTSTLITLIVIPVVYSMFEERSERAKSKVLQSVQTAGDLTPVESQGD
ncbi:MAG: efflux RND transporter permease subunit [Bryobacteraceae bacterium]|nr:efflux RND transporter permease subunit [Bryobacterales bacterium]NUN02278.1 efflux RND transporter permease subunit [Bryobacteraceae bacterium]